MMNLPSPAASVTMTLTVLEVARAGPGSEMSPLTRTTHHACVICRRQQRKMLSLRILDADYKQKINMNLTACSLVNRPLAASTGGLRVSVLRRLRLVLISSGPQIICNF